MTIERCPGTDNVPAHKAFFHRDGSYVKCMSCNHLVAYSPWDAKTPQEARLVLHYRISPTKEQPVTPPKPKPTPLDIAGLADRLFKVVKEAADMVNSFIETEVVPRAQEQDIAAAEEAERARKIRVHYSTGSGFSVRAEDIKPMETQPACGATVVMRRTEGLAVDTVFCMRTDGPCPYGPYVDVHGHEGAGYCAATGRRGRSVETDGAF